MNTIIGVATIFFAALGSGAFFLFHYMTGAVAASIIFTILICLCIFFLLNRASFGIAGFILKKSLSGNRVSSGYARINGIRIYYEAYGSGEPVLVLHGDVACLETMHHQISCLSKSHLVIVPDRRAHGRTGDDIEKPLSYSLMADDMIALLDELKIEQAGVVGWSGGGNDGIEMAIRYPDRVNRLVTYGSNFNPDGVDESLLEMLNPNEPDMIFTHFLYKKISPNPDHWPVYLERIKELWRTSPDFTTADLKNISVPCLIMAGENDVVPPAHTEELTAGIPNANLVILAEQDHFAVLKAPGTVNPHIIDFFERTNA